MNDTTLPRIDWPEPRIVPVLSDEVRKLIEDYAGRTEPAEPYWRYEAFKSQAYLHTDSPEEHDLAVKAYVDRVGL